MFKRKYYYYLNNLRPSTLHGSPLLTKIVNLTYGDQYWAYWQSHAMHQIEIRVIFQADESKLYLPI